MLNLKLSVFVASLGTAALVGGVVGSTFYTQFFLPEPAPHVCESAPAVSHGRNTFRHVEPINTGRDKGY